MPFPTSNLSQENILRDVHDPTTQSLRTNAQATIIAPNGLEVAISHLDDSIKIGDGVNLAKVTKAAVGNNAGLNVNTMNTLFTKPFTQLSVLTKNSDGDPLTIKSIYNGTDVQLMTIAYDSDGDLQQVSIADL
jgi:hypothetical protein